jgi:hypothetical protein
MSRNPTIWARTLGVIAVISAACSFAMIAYFPYRIHQGIYTWYLLAKHLVPVTSLTALVAMVSALALGIRSRQRIPIALGVLSGTFLFFSITQVKVHSGPNPQAWCYNNLRKIEAATSQLIAENQLTNGVAITGAQIAKYIDGGFDSLVCAEHGKYMISAVGTEARCSVHRSISEMERAWQKDMHR